MARRSYTRWIKDFEQALSHPPKGDPSTTLPALAWDAYAFHEQIRDSPEKAAALIQICRQVRKVSGRGRQCAEEKLMEHLRHIASDCCDALVEANSHPACERALDCIVQYALDCLGFRRPRDTFGGRRRAFSLEILGEACAIKEIPEALEYAIAVLDNKSANEVYGALCFFDHYFNHAQTEREMSEQLIGHLLETAEKTTKRSHAAAALAILVQYGAIGEFEAMDRMDDWKEKNLPHGW